jgi:shikimate dehydrogenase
MHNAAFRALGMDAIYLAFDVTPERLMGVLPAMAAMGFGGVNLTVPLKEEAFRGLSLLDESARRLGAVNTVEFAGDGGPLKGHNTDGAGFLTAIRESFGVAVRGLSVFVLGSGGAGRAVATTCAAEGAACVALTDLDPQRAQRVAQEIGRMNTACRIETVDPDATAWVAASRAADLVVQATPVGMKPSDASPLPASAFRSEQMAFDLVYMYPQTAFMRGAVDGGARAANGLGMLLHQGARAFFIWTGKQPPVDVMRRELEAEVYKKERTVSNA